MAMGKLSAAEDAMSPAGWFALARATETTAPAMNAQEIANALNALYKLSAAASVTSSSGWEALARATERAVGDMNAQEVSNALHAYGRLPAAAKSRVSCSGNDALEAKGRAGRPSLSALLTTHTFTPCYI